MEVRRKVCNEKEKKNTLKKEVATSCWNFLFYSSFQNETKICDK